MLSYAARLDFAADLRSYVAKTTMNATVSSPRDLACLALDFSGGTVAAVRINGVAVAHEQRAEKLDLLPASGLRPHEQLRISVTTRTKIPDIDQIDPVDFPPGIFGDGHWVQMIAQPSRAHRALPMADHPFQKAPWTIQLTVPHGSVGVADGTQTSHATGRTRDSFTYVMKQPVATHVLQLTVGPLRRLDQGTAAGVQIRNWIPRTGAGKAAATLAQTAQQLRWLTARHGAYPFAEYGIVTTPYGGELETQTLTTLATSEVQNADEASEIMLHELAHQWFGDSVSVRRWGSDLWLAEGHAVFYQSLYTDGSSPGTLDHRAVRLPLAARSDRRGWTDRRAATRPQVRAPRVGGPLQHDCLRGRLRSAVRLSGQGGVATVSADRTRLGQHLPQLQCRHRAVH